MIDLLKGPKYRWCMIKKSVQLSSWVALVLITSQGCMFLPSDLPETDFRSSTLPGKWRGTTECITQLKISENTTIPIPQNKNVAYEFKADGSLVYYMGEGTYVLSTEGMSLPIKDDQTSESGLTLHSSTNAWLATRSVSPTESQFDLQFLVTQKIETAEITINTKSDEKVSFTFKIVDGFVAVTFTSEKTSENLSSTPAGETTSDPGYESIQCTGKMGFFGGK